MDNKKIVIDDVRIISSKRIEVLFSMDDTLKCYFRECRFRVDYSTDIHDLPYGIAVIPFVCNVLPIVWLTNSTLCLDELDEDFYNCIEEIKDGYRAMYSNVNFQGNVICKPIRYKQKDVDKKSLVFFSGGVDAFATLIAHIDELPTLFSICGADVKLDDKKSWNVVMSQIEEVSKNFKIPTLQCYSNFREFINEEKLCALVADLGVYDDYWHGFQHGIGLIGHVSPLAYLFGYVKNYIASTYTIRERNICTCASDPRIDNKVKYCDARTYHDQFEYNRQEKICHIVEYCEKNRIYIKLRVCWLSNGGKNCCVCEKCVRTIYGILAENANPADYGFSNANLLKLKFLLKYKIKITDIVLPLWDDIINRLNQQKIGTTSIEWLRQYDAAKLRDIEIKKDMKRIKRRLDSIKWFQNS